MRLGRLGRFFGMARLREGSRHPEARSADQDYEEENHFYPYYSIGAAGLNEWDVLGGRLRSKKWPEQPQMDTDKTKTRWNRRCTQIHADRSQSLSA
jgi:hypothetical protein